MDADREDAMELVLSHAPKILSAREVWPIVPKLLMSSFLDTPIPESSMVMVEFVLSGMVTWHFGSATS